MKITKNTANLNDLAAQEYTIALAQQNQANIEYLAMMSDIDIGSEEGEENE